MKTSIRACYFESFQLEEKQFVETMLLDSCFIIQLFIKWSYNVADPVHNIGWVLPLLMADLIMIENQIPFFILQNMYNIYCYGSIVPPDNQGDMRPTLIKLAVQSMDTIHNRDKAGRDSNLRHLYYLLYFPAQEINLPGVSGSKDVAKKERSPRMIPSAKELQEFGVTFKKKKNLKSILDISFKNGVLEMPDIILEESSRSRSLNLIAFEQCISTDKKHLTSYAVFMDCLINTSEDVIALPTCGIIENKLADTTEVANFFKQLRDCAFMDYEDHYLRQVFVNIKKYCQAFWPKHRASFKTIYFIVTTF